MSPQGVLLVSTAWLLLKTFFLPSRFSLCSPGTHYADQAGFELGDLPVLSLSPESMHHYNQPSFHCIQTKSTQSLSRCELFPFSRCLKQSWHMLLDVLIPGHTFKDFSDNTPPKASYVN